MTNLLKTGHESLQQKRASILSETPVSELLSKILTGKGRGSNRGWKGFRHDRLVVVRIILLVYQLIRLCSAFSEFGDFSNVMRIIVDECVVIIKCDLFLLIDYHAHQHIQYKIWSGIKKQLGSDCGVPFITTPGASAPDTRTVAWRVMVIERLTMLSTVDVMQTFFAAIMENEKICLKRISTDDEITDESKLQYSEMNDDNSDVNGDDPINNDDESTTTDESKNEYEKAFVCTQQQQQHTTDVETDESTNDDDVCVDKTDDGTSDTPIQKDDAKSEQRKLHEKLRLQRLKARLIPNFIYVPTKDGDSESTWLHTIKTDKVCIKPLKQGQCIVKGCHVFGTFTAPYCVKHLKTVGRLEIKPTCLLAKNGKKLEILGLWTVCDQSHPNAIIYREGQYILPVLGHHLQSNEQPYGYNKEQEEAYTSAYHVNVMDKNNQCCDQICSAECRSAMCFVNTLECQTTEQIVHGFDVTIPTQSIMPDNPARHTRARCQTLRPSKQTGEFNTILTVHPIFNVTCLKAIRTIRGNKELFCPYPIVYFHYNTFKQVNGYGLNTYDAWWKKDKDLVDVG